MVFRRYAEQEWIQKGNDSEVEESCFQGEKRTGGINQGALQARKIKDRDKNVAEGRNH